MPAALGHDGQHAGGHLQDFRPVQRQDCQLCFALEDLHQLIAFLMALPGRVAHEAAGKNAAVAEAGQGGKSGAGFFFRRRRPRSFKTGRPSISVSM